jgi:soluble lytic murein transglycosylase
MIRNMNRRRARILRTGALTLAVVACVYTAALGLRILYPVDELDRVRAYAEAAGLDPALVCAVVRAESRFHADAMSPRGAVGLMQIMPDTAAWIAGRLDVNAFDLLSPETNLRFGTWYLDYLMDRFGGLSLALAAYNAGPTRVDRWVAEGTTPFPETAAYVTRVLRAVPVYRFILSVPILLQVTPSLPF